jgi:hypothetical protein
MYRAMAAEVGDRTKPIAARMKALDTLEQLQKKYKAINDAAYANAQGKPVSIFDQADAILRGANGNR